MPVFRQTIENVGILAVKDPTDLWSNDKKRQMPGLLGSNLFSLYKRRLAGAPILVQRASRCKYCHYMRWPFQMWQRIPVLLVFGKTPIKLE